MKSILKYFDISTLLFICIIMYISFENNNIQQDLNRLRVQLDSLSHCTRKKIYTINDSEYELSKDLKYLEDRIDRLSLSYTEIQELYTYLANKSGDLPAQRKLGESFGRVKGIIGDFI